MATTYLRPHDTRLIELLSRAEVHDLLNTCGSRNTKGVRDCALIAVLYGSGIRISEVLALHTRDIDHLRCAITIRCGKGKKRRVDLGLISLQLGHSNVATTARYVRELLPEAVLEVMAARQMWKLVCPAPANVVARGVACDCVPF